MWDSSPKPGARARGVWLNELEGGIRIRGEIWLMMNYELKDDKR